MSSELVVRQTTIPASPERGCGTAAVQGLPIGLYEVNQKIDTITIVEATIDANLVRGGGGCTL